jgi:GAF domain-containing protein
MRSFLGVAIMIRGYASGSLHLAEKTEGEFTDADGQAIVALAKDAADTIRLERRLQGKEAAK